VRSKADGMASLIQRTAQKRKNKGKNKIQKEKIKSKNVDVETTRRSSHVMETGTPTLNMIKIIHS